MLGVCLVHIRHYLLECGGIEPLCQNGSPSDNILSGFQFLGIPVQHFGFDFVPQCFGLGLCLFDQRFQILEGLDFGSDFSDRHLRLLLSIVGIAPLNCIYYTLNIAHIQLTICTKYRPYLNVFCTLDFVHICAIILLQWERRTCNGSAIQS